MIKHAVPILNKTADTLLEFDIMRTRANYVYISIIFIWMTCDELE